MQYNDLSGEELLKRIFEEDRTTVVKKKYQSKKKATKPYC